MKKESSCIWSRGKYYQLIQGDLLNEIAANWAPAQTKASWALALMLVLGQKPMIRLIWVRLKLVAKLDLIRLKHVLVLFLSVGCSCRLKLILGQLIGIPLKLVFNQTAICLWGSLAPWATTRMIPRRKKTNCRLMAPGIMAKHIKIVTF